MVTAIALMAASLLLAIIRNYIGSVSLLKARTMRRSKAGKEMTLFFPETFRQLHAYFSGELVRFDLPLRFAGTEFQNRVWKTLCKVPLGETISYGVLASRIGNPKASRAVGAANGRNPLPIVVPCHRVIGSNGSLTGFAGGIEIKKKLLDHEQFVARKNG
jgi:methylated-DNA-[protein]-cysteine S-methyltransferase